MTLSGKVAVITGGKRIGQVVAQELAGRGMDLVVSYRQSKDEALQTVADVRARGQRGEAVAADVSRPEDCARLVDQAVRAFGRLDVLISMASIYRSTSLDALTVLDWQEDIDINLRSAFLCAHAAVPHLRRAGGGRIVNVADWLPRSGRPRYKGFLPYYTAKAGLIALTESLALELARDQVLVNAVAPGPIMPPPDMTQAGIEAVVKATPLGRWGGAGEVARAVIFLCETDFVTGETIRVDGGRHLE